MAGRILTYGTSIHPGESWERIYANVRNFVPRVKRTFSPERSFPIALRLSARAAGEIDAEGSRRFLDWCGQEDCFVALINGFPFGAFHGVPVKERVYLPDWRSTERLDYTRLLADHFSRWLPEGGRGSISTVPIAFRGFVDTSDVGLCRRNILAALEHLDALAQARNRDIVLALEPEPGCLLETTEEAISFLQECRFPSGPAEHLGICFDCCHQALQFEDPVASYGRLRGAGVRIGHVQVSSALHVDGNRLDRLAAFDEACYLHQAVGLRDDGSLVRYRDLPEAARGDHSGVVSWRVHFHLPVYLEGLPGIGTTRTFIEEFLPLLDPSIPLEVETYTWEVLPAFLKKADVCESVAREMSWVRNLILRRPPPQAARAASALSPGRG